MRALLAGPRGLPHLSDVAEPEPGPGEVLVEVQCAGLSQENNSGAILGAQGTGRIIADPDSAFPEGTLVAWAAVPGACAQRVCVPRHRIVAGPQGIAPEVAATMLLPAMMAHVLLHSLHPIEAGSTVLINPADDPVGLLSAQWAHALGARVIAVSPSGEVTPHLEGTTVVKRAHVAPRRAAETEGIDLALHGAGKPGLEHAISSLRRRGMLCLYGNPEQPVKRLSPTDLAAQGSLSLACPVLEDYLEEPDGFRTRSQAVTQAIAEEILTIPLNEVVSPEEAVERWDLLSAEMKTGLVAVRF
ncbi:zinc-binding dehydrogenase [Corynebacterium lowii]|uniref:Quinone oxidoreductase 1 n=1 Tax=Corynebacterium lowii TaxID=1544413 RepID=A0A0Q0YGR5_9CORY|nr:zinc-binding dehydrogenase [Corynebacterium lowii]KQB85804.1 Quinone oxidoreductase 1 [Corynebacterium lowii]MDP9851106.1 NADPH2:quinone reductase [Corynebacterium lowii]